MSPQVAPCFYSGMSYMSLNQLVTKTANSWKRECIFLAERAWASLHIGLSNYSRRYQLSLI